MRRKRHEPILPIALDAPFGPPPEEYCSRCPVYGEAMLVNEAIIDVAIGVPNSAGNIPVGCPGWSVLDAMAKPWRTLQKRPSPPAGR